MEGADDNDIYLLYFSYLVVIEFYRLDTVELLVRTDPTLMHCLKRATPDIVYPHTPLHLASRNGHK